MKILFLQLYTEADYDRRKAQETVHDIQMKLKSIKFRKELEFSSRWAVNPENILQVLNEEEADIIHICARETNGGIAFATQRIDDQDHYETYPLETETLAMLLDVLNKKVKILYLDVPYSQDIAEHIQKNVDNVDYCIGMNGTLPTKAAKCCAANFYSALGFGLPISKAVGQAKAALLCVTNSNFSNVPKLYANANEVLIDTTEAKKDKDYTILFLQANPTKSPQLSSDAEAAVIQEKINASTLRDHIRFESRWTVQVDEIQDYLNEIHPQVLHFSGHGSEASDMAFEGEGGSVGLVPKEYIAMICQRAMEPIDLVFLNSCYSMNCAKEAANFAGAAIGMKYSVLDATATWFATQFYSSLGYGCDVETAFQQAKAALYLNDEFLFAIIQEAYKDKNITENQMMALVRKELDAPQLFSAFSRGGQSPAES